MSAASPVYVFGEARAPVYHRTGELRVVLDTPKAKVEVLLTACGRVVWRGQFNRDENVGWRYMDYARRLRHDWAAKIGRPCANCERAR